MAKRVKSKEEEDDTGFFIPAGIFFGLGFGIIFHQVAAGLLFGLGAGFLGIAVAKIWGRKK